MTLEELGAILRAERERRGLTIEDVSAHLKISVAKLRALEEGDTSSMPHQAYAKGFIRSYATYLGMASSEVIEAMQVVGAQTPVVEPSKAVREPDEYSPPPRGEGTSFGRLFVILIALGLLAGGSYLVWRSGFLDMLHQEVEVTRVQPALPLQHADEGEYVPQSTEKSATEGTEKSAEASSSSSSSSSSLPETTPPVSSANATMPSGASTLAATTPSPVPLGNGTAPTTTDTASASSAVTVLSGETDSAPQKEASEEILPEGQHKVIIVATETCWIRSTADRTDTRQFSLGKGDTFALTFRHRLDLRLGNAGGVRIRYDGKDFPLDARSGQVKSLVFPPKSER